MKRPRQTIGALKRKVKFLKDNISEIMEVYLLKCQKDGLLVVFANDDFTLGSINVERGRFRRDTYKAWPTLPAPARLIKDVRWMYLQILWRSDKTWKKFKYPIFIYEEEGKDYLGLIEMIFDN